MANVNLHFDFVGPTQAEIQKRVGPATITSTTPSAGMDIQVDSALQQDLIDFMGHEGYLLGQSNLFEPLLNWTKYTVLFSDIAAAALTNDIELFQLPAKGVIHQCILKHTQAFTGGAIATYTLSVGIAANFIKYAAAFNVFQAPGNAIFGFNSLQNMEGFGPGATSIRVRAVSTVGNLNAATQGSCNIWVLSSKLP